MPPSTAPPARRARLLRGLWRVPAYEPYLQPSLTDGAVAAVEAQLGVKLPATYLEALRVQNGGYLRRTYPELEPKRLWGIGPAGPHLGSRAWDTMCAAVAQADGWLPPERERLVPFDGDGHWFACFDYRRSGPRAEPAVTLVDLELERERRVAASFDAFLARCDVDTCQPVWGVSTDVPLAPAASRLAAALRRPVTDLGDQAHGVQQFEIALRARGEKAWAFVSANRQPRSWWPADRPRPSQSARLEGTALAWPEHPECALIVVASRDFGERVGAACAKVFGGAPTAIVA